MSLLAHSISSNGVPLNSKTHPLILTRLYHRWVSSPSSFAFLTLG